MYTLGKSGLLDLLELPPIVLQVRGDLKIVNEVEVDLLHTKLRVHIYEQVDISEQQLYHALGRGCS